ncbi:hypothetical protein EVAR_35240_1 [Eumeta japonica]|uniref:Histone-lysine N-methyltransferase SETMAR n=1 Tax=Eumeta variegata TaxID=151549 RepID=A0A4C1VCZ6_EUMVA|nr:hypothetical protein EVAR_35240_1 [Eumeta japonica]
MIKDDKRCTYHMFQNALGIGSVAVHKTLQDELKMRKIISRWIPHPLRQHQNLCVSGSADRHSKITGLEKAIKLKGQKTVKAAWYTRGCLPIVLQTLRIRGFMLHHDSASSHTSAVTGNFLKESNIVVLEHPPYSPDLATCDLSTSRERQNLDLGAVQPSTSGSTLLDGHDRGCETRALRNGLRNRHALTARSRHEQKEFKEADARLTAAATAPPRAPRRA